ncbi:fungal specific transcription factor domain containing protein [Venturia nashicola]|uniref:Fungal specific transcription factor domain containing protein n=1 Tax=Venturia nashicola TaxID=86259 RepID=A0A4Z1P217_9PEZI|nr:fungal specific transcription factor domain containing protein [Venturia nashicola]
MPSRASSCRHVARSIPASNLFPLYISDEVLDNAFDRFLSVSRTAKRYGSCVPGPLEAQRRLAKRRMAGLVTMGGSAAFDVGFLFGSGPPTRDELKWHAPAKNENAEYSKEPEPRSTVIETWTSILHRLQIQEAQRAQKEKVQRYLAQTNTPKSKLKGQLPFKTRLKNLRTVAEARTLAQEARESHLMNPVEFSRCAYKQLLLNRVPNIVLLEYLKDPTLNMPQVHNVMKFIADRQANGLLISRDFYTTLSRLLSLGMVQSPEMLEILDALPELDLSAMKRIWKGMKECRVVPDWSLCARRLLMRLNLKHVVEGSGSLKLELYRLAFPMHLSRMAKAPDLGQHLAYWVKSIHAQLPNKAEHIDRASLVDIVAIIGRIKKDRPFLLAVTARLLQQKPADDVDLPQWHSLVSGWLSILLDAKTGAKTLPAREKDPRQLDHFYDMISEHLTPCDLIPFFETQAVSFSSSVIAQVWLPRLSTTTWSAADSAAIQRDLRLIPNTDLRSSKCTRPTDHFADIAIALARRGFEYQAPMAIIVEFCHGLYGVDGVFWLVKTWRYAQVRVIPEALGGIMRTLAQTDSWAALALYHRARLWIGCNPEILPKLITNGLSAHKVLAMLNHRDPTNSVPVHLRDKPKNILHHTRNTLVHIVADAFSRSHSVCTFSRGTGYKQLRNRQVFRNVYRAYRYLVTRQSPIRPLMARALVRAAIIRPLDQNEWVNTARVKFILEIVRRVEGKEVADELDKKIYLWRGKVHRFLMWRESYLRRQGIDPHLERGRREELRRKSREGQALRRHQAIIAAPVAQQNDTLSSPADALSISPQFDALAANALTAAEDDVSVSQVASGEHDQASHTHGLDLRFGTLNSTFEDVPLDYEHDDLTQSRETTDDGSQDLTSQDLTLSQLSTLLTRHFPSAYWTGSPRGGFRQELTWFNHSKGALR